MQLVCFECGADIDGADLSELEDNFLHHAHSRHDWPYPEQAIRNYAAATQRLTGPSDRLSELGPITIEEVTDDRIDDWLSFFDHDAFVGTPEWAACYCLEPHIKQADTPPDDTAPSWTENRASMVDRLKRGESFGYLAYEGSRPIGWVNASKRSDYTLYQSVDPGGPPADSVVGVSCFIIAPPYRRHSVAARLLDRVLEDAASRGADWVEAYPFNSPEETDSGNFRGPQSMFVDRGFERIEERGRDTVMRRRADVPGDR